jgi:hypothetical protein
MGTFRGYGGYVGVNPYREVAGDAADELLGRTAVELLGLSGPTGVAFADAREFLAATRDVETEQIRHRHGLDRPGLSTAKLAGRFLGAEVVQLRGQKSWVVQRFHYDPTSRANTGGQTLRVKHADGPAALGVVLRQVMDVTGLARGAAGKSR